MPACKYLRVSRFVGSSHRAGVSHLVECWGGADLIMAAVKDADQHQSQVGITRSLFHHSRNLAFERASCFPIISLSHGDRSSALLALTVVTCTWLQEVRYWNLTFTVLRARLPLPPQEKWCCLSLPCSYDHCLIVKAASQAAAVAEERVGSCFPGYLYTLDYTKPGTELLW